MINQLCREIIAYADKKPFDVEIQRIAAMAKQLLEEQIPVTTLEELARHEREEGQ